MACTLPEGANGTEARVLWSDQEEITAEQRKKIFAIIAEIANWSAHDPEYLRKNLTKDFLMENREKLWLSILSLSSGGGCDKGMASLFIDFLIDFCLENNVPTSRPLQEYADDLEKYTYSALLHKRCIICGKKADLHHCDAIGMGFNRNTKPQLGARVLPLCRVHHTEYHTIGGAAFGEKYHIVPVALDKRLAQKYNITGRAAS
jgi:hypothetical protein